MKKIQINHFSHKRTILDDGTVIWTPRTPLEKMLWQLPKSAHKGAKLFAGLIEKKYESNS